MRSTESFAGKRFRVALLMALGLALAMIMLILSGCGEEAGNSASVSLTEDTGGRLQITETLYDFGPIPVGTQVEHKFQLKNTGTGPLNLGEMSVKRLEGC